MTHYTRRIFLFLMLLSGLTFNMHKGQLALSSAAIHACGPNGFGGGSGGGGGDGTGGGGGSNGSNGSNSQTIIGANYLTTVPNTNPQVGTTAGSFNVSATGGATYTVPIVVPSGPGGLQPSLAISYNSQSGNGVMGMGMNLSGLSAVTRAPSTVYYNNGAATPIQVNATDNYAIDGARLLLCNGSAGTQGAEYRTEAENFSKVVINAANSFGPTWFEITTKDGTIYRYGSAGGRFADPNNSDVVLAWYLDYVQDANGNYMTYSYRTDNNVVYLDNIKYGGNINTGTDCTMTVQMNYESRTDITATHYISRLSLTGTTYNLKGKATLLLSQILVQNSGSTIREYDAYYYYDLFARLIGIYEKGENGAQYKPTTFNWYSQQAVSDISSSWVGLDASNVSGNVTILSTDLNGDGLDDLIAIKQSTDSHGTTTSTALINTASKDGQNVTFNLTANIQLPTIVNWNTAFKMSNGVPLEADITGSGKKRLFLADFISDAGLPAYVKMYWIDSNYCTNDNYDQYQVRNGSQCPLMGSGDINQDGKDEVIFLEKDGVSTTGGKNYWLGIYYGNNMMYHFQITLPSDPEQLFIADFNGDGLPDICVLTKGQYMSLPVYQSGIWMKGGYTIFYNGGATSSQPFTLASTKQTTELYYGLMNDEVLNPDQFIRMGDFNGDGLPDFISNTKGTTDWYLSLNNGDGTFSSQYISNIDLKTNSSTSSDDNKFNCYVLDLDGDGKSDIVVKDANNTKWYRSNGNGFDLIKSSSTASNNSNNLIAQGDFDGNGRQELYNHGSDMSYGNGTCYDRIYNNPGYAISSGSMWQIIDGLGVQTTITYNSLTNNSIYTKGSNSEYPVIDITPVMPAVSGVVLTSNGYDVTQYSYAGAQMHLIKGFLGFTSASECHEGQGATTKTSRSLNTTWYVPSTVTSQTSYSDGSTVSSTTLFNFTAFTNNTLRYLQLPSTKTDQDIYGNNIITSYNYDGNGNMLNENTAFGSGMYKQTTYSNYITAGSYLPNKPQLVTTTWKHPDDGNTFVTQTATTYDTTHGYLTQKTDNNQILDKQVTTTYSDFDGWGNPQTVSVAPTGMTANKETFKYDPTGRFVTLHTTPLNSMVATYNAWGQTLTSTDDLNRTIINTYDGLGRLANTTYPDGRTSTQALCWGSDINLCYFLYNETTGKPWTKTWYDNLGRVVKTESVGMKELAVTSSKRYNMNGQIGYTSSSNGGISMSCGYQYDAHGRTTSETYNNGKTVSYSYGNRTATTTTDGKTTNKTVDAWGNPVRVSDPVGNTVNYTYYSCGKPHTVSAAGALWSMAYDKVGNQIQLVDPDAGTFNYLYNPLGQITSQTDAKNSTIIAYDAYDRLLTKTRNGLETTTYTYVDSGDGKGKVQNVSGSNGYQISYGYDHYDRLTSEIRLVDGENFNFGYGYDDNGNLINTTYPTGYIVNRVYDDNGFVDQVTEGNNTLWQQGSYTGTSSNGSLSNGTLSINTQYLSDGRLQLLNSQVGSTNLRNFTYDFNLNNGNLNSRTDGVKNTSDSFTYDNLYRLTVVTGNNHQTIAYDTNGNITSKSNAGTFSYAGGMPHTITSIKKYSSLIPNTEQDISYTSFDKVASITEGVNNLTISYTPDEVRAKTVLLQNGTTQKNTIFDGDYERETFVNNIVRHLHYIALGNGVFAVMVRNSNSGTDSLYYVHPDHLGSYTLVTDAQGNVKERATYDPWGLRIVSEGSLIFSRGFTGHEHLDAFKLINMNGRCYDPVLGRFLSSDPFVQASDNIQCFNRYSYCVNNPFKYTDPSGKVFGIDDAIAILLMTYIGGIQANFDSQKNSFNPVNWNWKCSKTYIGMASGATAGFGMVGISILPQVPGIIANGTLQAGFQVTLNGIGNLIDNKSFFNGWFGSATIGFVSGAVSGYGLAKEKGLNYWWGSSIAYNRTNWSFFNTDIPDRIIDFHIQNVGTMADNDCVPSSFAEMENKIGGPRNYDDFKQLTNYQDEIGVLTSREGYKTLINHTFENYETLCPRDVNTIMFDPNYMQAASDEGDVFNVRFQDHSDVVRQLEVFDNDPSKNTLIFRQGHYNSNRFSNIWGKVVDIFRIFK